jgi:DNA-binding MurR/RpiR family transcriptional regulator
MNIEKVLREKYSSLSKGQKKVADFLLKDIVSFSMTTASQIAKKIDVSETTVIRLSYALEFESFSQMQKMIQKDYLTKKDEPLDLYEKEDKQNFIDHIIENDIANLRAIKNNLDMSKFWTAIDDIMSADVVKIVGFRASYSAAHWLYLKLGMMRNNVEIVSSNSTNYPDDLLMDEKKNTVFIFISFPSYVAESLAIAEMAINKGAKCITITDRLLSPVSRISHISFTTQISVDSENLIPISSIMSLLNIFARGIEQKYEKKVIERVTMLQNLYKERGYFLE